MSQNDQPLCLIMRFVGEAPGASGWTDSQRSNWWNEVLPDALQRQKEVGGQLLGSWQSDWSSDYQFFTVTEYPDLESLERGVELLRNVGVFRYANFSRLLLQRWEGEPGWNAEQWTEGSTATLGFLLFYRISESLYTFTPEDMVARHDSRRALLSAAIENLIQAGGKRVGAYFGEWSSEWHLIVLYEAPDLASIADFNAALPERHGFIDYDVDFLIGRKLEAPDLVPRF